MFKWFKYTVVYSKPALICSCFLALRLLRAVLRGLDRESSSPAE